VGVFLTAILLAVTGAGAGADTRALAQGREPIETFSAACAAGIKHVQQVTNSAGEDAAPEVRKLLRDYDVWTDAGPIADGRSMEEWLANLAASNAAAELRLMSARQDRECWIAVTGGLPPHVSELPPFEVHGPTDGVLLVRWRHCGRGTADQILRQLAARTQVRSLVLDLRGNAGGHLIEAVRFCEPWVPKGTTLLRLYRTALDRQAGKPRLEFTTQTEPRSICNCSVVCITDARTASTAEALVAMMKAHGIARSVGARTCGDGIAYVFEERPGEPERGPTAVPALIEVVGFPIYHNRGIVPDRELVQDLAKAKTRPGAFEAACLKAADAWLRDDSSAPGPRSQEAQTHDGSR
jgi:hypothetical protein